MEQIELLKYIKKEDERMNDIGIEKYRLHVLVQNEKLDIPVFQRKFRWSPSKQRELINSIKNEYPIGVITTYIDSENTFTLDGLQRLTTIKRFLANPRNVFEWKDLSNYKFLDQLNVYINKLNNKKRTITATLRNIYDNLIDNDQVLKRFTAFKDRFLSINTGMKIDDDILEEIFIRFTEIFKLDSLIPVIEYKGDIENVADIFEKMNTGSVTLSKYEVFAASWSNFQVDIEDTQFDPLSEYYEVYSYVLNNKFKDEFNITNKNSTYNISELFVVMSYKILNSIDFNDVKIAVPKLNATKYYDKNIFYKDEFFHEIFAGYTINMPTRIDKYVKDNFTTKKIDFDWDYIRFIDSFSNYVVDHVNIVINEFKKSGFTDEKPNPLNYLFLFVLTSSLMISTYTSDNSIFNRNETDCLIKLKNDIFNIKKMVKERWFKDEYRQVTFLNEKLELVKKIINNDIYESIYVELSKNNLPNY